MTQKDITLRIKTVETELKQSLKKIERLENTINKLNNKNLKPKTSAAQKALEKLNKEIEEGLKLVDKFNQGAGLSAFGSKISSVTEQVSLIKKAFNDATTATERQRAATAILAGDFKKLTMEATAFANATDKRRNKGLILGNVGETIKEIEKFPKTILAGRNAMSMLNSMLEVVNVNSQEFKDINEAIGRQLEKNASIEKKINKLTGSPSKRKAKKDELENEKKRKSILDKTNALLQQTANIEERIKSSTLNKTQKEKLLNDLKQAGVKIKKQEFQLAKQINIETQKNLTMQEKLQRRRSRITQSALIGGGFPLLFGGGPAGAIAGALGGGIGEAISPGGGFAGSIAATAAVNSLGQFANSARELAEAVKTTSGTLELMEERTLFSSDAIEKQAKALQDQGKEAELAALLTDELTKALGPGGLGQLAGLAEESREMNRQFGILKTQMELFIAGPMTNLIKFINSTLTKANIVNQLDKSLTELRKIDPKAYKLAVRDLKEDISFVDKINPVSASKRSFLGGLINPANLQVQGIPVGGFDVDFLGKRLQDINNQLPSPTLPFQSNLDTTNGKSSRTKDFSKFEINILKERIALQKSSGSLLDADVVKIKKAIIESEKLLAIEKAGNHEGKKKIAELNATRKISELNKDIQAAKLKDEKELLKFLEKQKKALDDQIEKEKKLADQEVKRFKKLKENANSVTENLKLQNQLNLIKLSGSEYEIALAEATLGFNKGTLAAFDEEAFKIQRNNKLRIDSLLEQKRLTQEINTLLATEMSFAIKGLITGANSLNDAFRNILNKMADAFLNMALFGNVGGSLTQGGGLLGAIFGGLLHAGGPAKGGRSYIVGEKGPEMFTPGVSGMVTPNNALGGSTNIVVNVDASGSSVEGDEASSSQLGKLIGLAVQQELVKQSRAGGLLSRA